MLILTLILTVALALVVIAAARLARTLRENEAKFRMVVETMQEGVILRDAEGEIVLANAQGLQILGLTLDQLRGHTEAEPGWRAVDADGHPLAREGWPSHTALLSRAAQRERTMGIRMPWGETIWLSVTAVPLFRREETQPYLVVTTFSDITVRRRREDRNRRQIERANDANAALARANAYLTEAAMTDGLTGLRNRRAFKEGLLLESERSGREGYPVSLIMLDVDEFKAYNDRFGHPAGDEALRTVARILTTVARTTDLVARYGGEEFAILLPEADECAVLQIAERLRSAIETTTWPLRAITASLGVATLRDGDDIERLVAEADAALYAAKRGGRNRVAGFHLA